MEHCVISPSPKTIVSAALPARAISIFENNNFFETNPLDITSSSGHIFVPSNIPIVLEEDIKLDCILDSLGDENNVANVIKGPKLKKSYVDHIFLSDYLMGFSNAKN